MHIQKASNNFVYYGLKRLDFNKGWNVSGYLGVENENESWVDMSWIFHFKGWSVHGLIRLATLLFTHNALFNIMLRGLYWSLNA